MHVEPESIAELIRNKVRINMPESTLGVYLALVLNACNQTVLPRI